MRRRRPRPAAARLPGAGLVPAVAVAVAGLLLALVPGPSVARDVAPAGSDGIGDPYFPLDGNGGIDVRRYEVHDRYVFGTRRLSGWTRVTLRATETLSSFDLDFLLPVSEVRVDGRATGFDRPDAHELRVLTPVAAGTTYEVVVRYAGHPSNRGWDGEHSWLASGSEVVAMNEPHMAAWWFPANDHPRDKALMDISITSPRDVDVVANGRRVSRTVDGRLATTRWRADEPMAPYLAFFAAGDFVVRQGSDHGLPWLVAVSRRIPSRADRSRSLQLMLRTPDVAHWLQGQLGPYPFSTTGGLTTSLEPGFALENQTRPTYPVLGSDGVGTVVHELAHQWFGDSVSVQGWRDIWLNEGAATFMEQRYAETHGDRSAQAWLQDTYDDYADDSWFWDLELADPGPFHLFDWPVYERGGMLLQALRHRIGNDVFWPLLRRWLAEHRGGTGSTEEFEALAQQVSGQDLTGFFQAWLHGTTAPEKSAANGLA